MKQNLKEEIKRLKELISEAPSASNNLFGGNTVRIPSAGAHKGQSGWQSANAWDIPGSIGTPVYAVTTGTLQTFSDYGSKPVRTKGKTLFGQSFTVKSEDGKPDVYYTHLTGSPFRQGDNVKCGDLVGYITDFPGSSYDHVHIGVQSGHDIKELIGNDGKIKCGNILPSSGTSNEKDELDDLLGTNINGISLKDLIGITDDDIEAKPDFIDTLINLSTALKSVKKL
jgi:hypothetical protein